MARMTGSRGIGLVVCAGAVVGLATGGGCGKGDRWWKKNNEPIVVDEPANSEVDTSLTALSRDDEPIAVDGEVVAEQYGTTSEQLAASARMVEEYFSGMEAGVDPVEAVVIDEPKPVVYQNDDTGSGPTTDSGNESGSFSLSQAAAERGIDESDVDELIDEPTDDPIEVVAVDTSVDAEQRKAELVSELVGVLTELARTSENPGAAAAALAGMDSISIETLDGLRDEGVLSETELGTLRAVREVLDSISSSGEIASPSDVAEALDRVKRDLDRQSGIRVVRALLCTRVDGFGKYEPFSSNEFVAGTAQEVIVYVEVDRFGHRELTGNDGLPRFEVEMSQRLELYHVADDLNTWNRAAEVDRSVSRNLVRDWYLINKITLPTNLGVGRYHLKVVMRDLVEEKVAEMIIPIRMVVR